MLNTVLFIVSSRLVCDGCGSEDLEGEVTGPRDGAWFCSRDCQLPNFISYNCGFHTRSRGRVPRLCVHEHSALSFPSLRLFVHLGKSSQEPDFLRTAPWLPEALVRSSCVKFMPLTCPVTQPDLPSVPSSSCSAQVCVAYTRLAGHGAREPAASTSLFCKNSFPK